MNSNSTNKIGFTAIAESASDLRADTLAQLPDEVDAVKIRADLLPKVDPDELRQRFRGELLYSLRSREFEGSPSERIRRIKEAARVYDLIEFEFPGDLAPETLAAAPPEKRALVWRGGPTTATGLRRRFEEMKTIPARRYRLTAEALSHTDSLQPLLFLKQLQRDDTVAFASGPFGAWTRFIAPLLGGANVSGVVATNPRPDAIPVRQLVQSLSRLGPPAELFGFIGSSVFKSPSPSLHNAAYRALDYPGVYVPFYTENFASFWRELANNPDFHSLGLPLRGMTIAAPHKESVLAFADDITDSAQQAQSANLVYRRQGRWLADSTDAMGIAELLKERDIDPHDRKIAVIGCGGSGRAMALQLSRSGARVSLVNRNLKRGEHAESLLDLPLLSAPNLDCSQFDIVVNATPVGGNGETHSFSLENLHPELTVVDLVYRERDATPLIAAARQAGCATIDGSAMLRVQVRQQFRLMTSRNMPNAAFDEVLRPNAETRSQAMR
ncbi:MAG: 3-dehydroquinate dehydratase/shikimate dehydrogenase [Limisphaerales bacterium]|jgi:3-dehydroquinate dehydratase/shikimate dehydrogenase